MKILKPLVLFLLICSFGVIVYAHPGQTDANGGHYNHSTGEYHYHHGYPAHSHAGGCPYDYDDKTGASSGSSSGGSYYIPDDPPKTNNSSGSSNSNPIEKRSDFIVFLRILGLALLFDLIGVSTLISVAIYTPIMLLKQKCNPDKAEENTKGNKAFFIFTYIVIPIVVASIIELA
jgi:hypothetical protein